MRSDNAVNPSSTSKPARAWRRNCWARSFVLSADAKAPPFSEASVSVVAQASRATWSSCEQASSSSWQALSSSFVAHRASARTSSFVSVSLASRAFRRARASSGGCFLGGRPRFFGGGGGRRRVLGRRLRGEVRRRLRGRDDGLAALLAHLAFQGGLGVARGRAGASPAARCRRGQRRERRPRRARGALLAREDVAAGALRFPGVDLGVAGRAGFWGPRPLMVRRGCVLVTGARTI